MPYYPPATSGGAITVTDGTTTVEDVTTLTLDGGVVSDEGAGEASVHTARVHYGEEDPGAVGAGAIWIRPPFGTGPLLFIRSEADDGWLTPILAKVASTDDFTTSEVTATQERVTLSVTTDDGTSLLEVMAYAQTGAFTIANGDGTLFSVSGEGVSMPDLPTTNPEVAGSLYTDGAPAAGSFKELLVSGGPA